MAAVSARSDSPEWNTNLHAPWRIPYIRALADDARGCFLCRARDEHDRAEENLRLWVAGACLVVLNKFPYTGGHLLIAPTEHLAALGDVGGDVLREMMELTADCVRLLEHTVHAEGFNVGLNIGRCAGAGLPDHVHLHLVPRWGGDTNFMAVLGDVRMVHQSLKELRRELLAAGEELRLPRSAYAR